MSRTNLNALCSRNAWRIPLGFHQVASLYRIPFVVLLVLVAGDAMLFGAAEGSYREAPALRARVEAGELPPVEERLPADPLVIELGTYGIHSVGEYGGVLRFDAVDAPNVQGWTDVAVPFFRSDKGDYLPLAWKGNEVSDDATTWTFYLREGMKWSDGHPYTADDVLFYVEACAFNKELTPVPPPQFTLNGKRARVEALSPYAVRFTFEKPNITYLTQIGPLERTVTGCPRHYLKAFHADYADADELERLIREEGMDTWTQLFTAKMDIYQNSNADLPTLTPWAVAEGIPSNPARYVRNPYYWVVDAEGRQLPYADEQRVTVVGNPERMKLRKVSGAVSMSPVQLDSVELVRRNADKGKIKWQMLPPPGDINSSTLCFNLLTPDPFKRRVLNDRRFRFAMSLQMPRDVMAEVIYNGLVIPKQIGISNPDHPWYNEDLATAYLDHDLDKANRLLDEMGLTDRDAGGFRLDPNGRPITFALQTVSHPEWSVVCEIFAEGLEEVGLKANLRMVGWDGLSDTLREGKWELFVLQCPMGYPARWPHNMENMRPSTVTGQGWHDWLTSDGARGQEPPPLMKECWQWWQKARMANNRDSLAEAIGWLQSTAAEQLFGVGILSFPPQLRVHAPDVRNVPEKERFFLKSAIYFAAE